jgi:hypothetical protein
MLIDLSQAFSNTLGFYQMKPTSKGMDAVMSKINHFNSPRMIF